MLDLRKMLRTVNSLLVMLSLLFTVAQANREAWGAADQLEELLQEQTKVRREDKVKELQRREQLENLKREQNSSQLQRQLDQSKQENFKLEERRLDQCSAVLTQGFHIDSDMAIRSAPFEQ